MRINKMHGLLHLLAIAAIVYLAPANCGHTPVETKPPQKKTAPVSPANAPVCPPAEKDNEIEVDTDDEADIDANTDEAPDAGPSCDGEDDCECGYLCVEAQCQKFSFTCCTDEECKIGDFCNKDSDGKNGVCARSQCNKDDDCDRCGTRCLNHTCILTNCCTDADCTEGKVCTYDFGQPICLAPQCTTDADCGCGRFCNTHYGHMCSSWDDTNADEYPDSSRNPCCGDEIYYNGTCLSHEYIEDGHCLSDNNCPTGYVCLYHDKCLPATCAENADCGCEAVCRKGHCEEGCDDSNGCCNEGDICDRGECINPNEEDEEEDE